MKFLTIGAIVALGIRSAAAQTPPDPQVPQGDNLRVPIGWTVHQDPGHAAGVVGASADSADIFFVNMTPGWHISTGPASNFSHPANRARGAYAVNSVIHLFDTDGNDRAGFGLFFAGHNLESQAQYMYFLIRNTGEFTVGTNSGTETRAARDWTRSDAIVRYTDPNASSVRNRLTLHVSGDSVRFSINDVEVHQMDIDSGAADGAFGLRVQAGLNLHVEDLSVGS